MAWSSRFNTHTHTDGRRMCMRGVIKGWVFMIPWMFYMLHVHLVVNRSIPLLLWPRIGGSHTNYTMSRPENQTPNIRHPPTNPQPPTPYPLKAHRTASVRPCVCEYKVCVVRIYDLRDLIKRTLFLVFVECV